MVMKSIYRGFLAPVFTPFNAQGKLNLIEVPKYARYLLENRVNGVLVNGTMGEGGSMNNVERMKLTEAWIDASKSTGQKIMVQVGGTNFNNVIELAKHAETSGAWSILCLPELYFRPQTIAELIHYLKMVGAAAINTPLFYYHYPLLTGVALDMVKFLDKAHDEIPTLAGLKYTHNNLDEGIRCVEFRNRLFTIFLGSDQLLPAAFSMGFDSMTLSILNFAAIEVHAIRENVQTDGKGSISNAMRIHNRLRNLTDFIRTETQRINGFKNTTAMITKLNLGAVRSPLQDTTPEQFTNLETYLKRFNWI